MRQLEWGANAAGGWPAHASTTYARRTSAGPPSSLLPVAALVVLLPQMISLMDNLLKRENLDLRLTPYRVLPTGALHA